MYIYILTNWSSSMAVRCLGHIYVVTSLFSNYFKKTVHVRALESVKANPQIDLPVINSLLYGFGGCGVMGFMCICLSIPHALVSFLLGRCSMHDSNFYCFAFPCTCLAYLCPDSQHFLRILMPI